MAHYIFIILLLLNPNIAHADEIIVYDYTEEPEKAKVVEPCMRKCKNETLSEGYGEPDPQDYWDKEDQRAQQNNLMTNQVIDNILPYVSDPIMRFILINQYSK